ncbi:MAG: hypothetical protein R6V29_10445 [Spirochaetia bacterium]
MFQSHAFQKRIRKIDSNIGADDQQRVLDDVRSAFDASLPYLPEVMRAELFDFFSQKYRADAERYTVDDAVFLGEVIDLFTSEYNEEADPFDTEDWEFVKDIIDENALELDMELINYVMKRIVEKGIL